MSVVEPAATPAATTAAARRPAHLLLDVVAVVLLVGLALLGLTTTFGGWGFLLLGTGAAALGAGLAVLTSRLPLAVPISVVPLVGLLLGGPLALRSAGLGAGVPDLQTLSDVLQGATTGWGELLATLPPVDLAGAPALVPYLLGFLGGALATGVAVRTRSAALPLLPLLGVLVVVLLLRRPEGFAQDWYPLGFAALALVWMAVRGLELAPEAGETRGWSHGRLRRTAGAAVVIAAALLARHRPDCRRHVAGREQPAWCRRQRGRRQRARLTVAAVPELHRPGRRLPRQRARQAAAQAGRRSPRQPRAHRDPGPLRRQGVAPGQRHHARHRRRRLPAGRHRVDSGLSGPRIRVRVELAKAYRSAWVPTIGALSSFRFLFANGVSERDQLRYDLATSTAVVPLGLEPGNDYEFTAVLPPDELSASSQAVGGSGPRGRRNGARRPADQQGALQSRACDAQGLRPGALPARRGSVQRRSGCCGEPVPRRARPRPSGRRLPARPPPRGQRRAVRRSDGVAGQPGRRTGARGRGGRGPARRHRARRGRARVGGAARRRRQPGGPCRPRRSWASAPRAGT